MPQIRSIAVLLGLAASHLAAAKRTPRSDKPWKAWEGKPQAMEGLPGKLSDRDARVHSRLAPAVQRLWCSAINYCNGSYGNVQVGALQARSSPIVRSGLLTTNSTDASWQPGTVRCAG